MYNLFFKRVIDIIVSLFGLVLALPLLIIIFILLLYFNKGKIFFKQKRTGLGEKIFTIYKFKTMTDEKDKDGKLLSEKYRLTKVGKFLRKTSLDEIPQLLNVLIGDMSLIGPRPLLTEYLPFYTDEERRRMSVRPGITGLSQIKGRNNILWDDRVKYDLQYVDNLTFFTDFKIIANTLFKVIKKDDVLVDEGEKGRVKFHVRRDPQNAGKYDNNGFLIENNQNK